MNKREKPSRSTNQPARRRSLGIVPRSFFLSAFAGTAVAVVPIVVGCQTGSTNTSGGELGVAAIGFCQQNPSDPSCPPPFSVAAIGFCQQNPSDPGCPKQPVLDATVDADGSAGEGGGDDGGDSGDADAG